MRLLDDFNDNDLAGVGRQRAPGRYQDVVLDSLILRNDDRHAALIQQASNELVGAALDDFDDLALGAAAPVAAADAREHAVAVQHLAHLMLGQDQVLSGIVTDQEAVAVAMALDLAGDQIGARRDEQQSGPVAHDAPRALEFFKFSRERSSRFVREVHTFGKFVRCQRRACRGQCLQYRVGLD